MTDTTRKKLEVVQVNHSIVNHRVMGLQIVLKDEEGGFYEATFLARSHYLDSIKKTFSRLSPAKMPAGKTEKHEEEKNA